MDNAVNAVNRLISKDPASDQLEGDRGTNNPNKPSKPSSTDCNADTTVDSEVSPAVEHRHIKKQHETREQTYIDRERHQDHYHTTVQPVKESEVLPEKHDRTQETKHRNINHDNNAAREKASAGRAAFKNTSDQQQFESKRQEPTHEEEHVHHHLHETVQPVIEKEVIDPSVTHKRVDMKEKIQEPAEYHGVTTDSTISAEEFRRKFKGAKVEV